MMLSCCSLFTIELVIAIMLLLLLLLILQSLFFVLSQLRDSPFCLRMTVISNGVAVAACGVGQSNVPSKTNEMAKKRHF